MSERAEKPTILLVCSCGKRLNAAGAAPGRVGRCPACGKRFQVPGAAPVAPVPPASKPAAATAGEEVLPPRAPVGSSAYVALPGQGTGPGSGPTPGQGTRARQRHGLILAPERPETRLRDSLLYPFWGTTGLGLLVFMPPAFWFTSLPMISAIAALMSEQTAITTRFGLMFLFPIAVSFALVLGYTLLFLGRVLVTSALGEVHHPRWPDWDLEEMSRGMGRWFWAVLVGVVVGGFPSVVYWLYCGDIDPLDVVIFGELLAVGALYAQMALLASLLHDDPLGANPFTVLRAIFRAGWSYAYPCLVSGFALVLASFAFAGLFAIRHPTLAALALWAFWVLILYLAMVALRVLGLYYHRHARVFGWFRDRPRWGV